MGSTRNTMYQEILRDDNKENILSLLNSDIIYFLLKITQYSEPPNYKNEFKILNMIGKPNTGSLKTNEDIYKYYGINENEKAFIASIINELKSKPSKTLKKKPPSTSHSKTRKSPPTTKPKSKSPSPSRTLKAKTQSPTKKKTRKKGKKLKIKTAP
jgi:hypothetical protein